MRARNYICSLSWEGIYDLTFQQGLKVIFKTRQGKVLGKVSSVALWAFIRPALPSSGEPTLDHAVLFMCFKSTIVVIFWKGQAAVEVILTLFSPFPPSSPVVNKWACVHPQHHPSHLYYWIWINSHPPTSTVDFFSPDIDSMHEPAQFTAKQIPLLNLTALLWWALHWFLDGGCLAPPHGREELFAGWRDACSPHPNCFIVLGTLKWLLLKCSVKSALLLPRPHPSPGILCVSEMGPAVYSDTAVTMQQYSPSCFRTNYQQ